MISMVFKSGDESREMSYQMSIEISVDSNNKINYRNSQTNLLSLINLSLAHTYYSIILSNHKLIRLKNSCRKLVIICVIIIF